MRIETVVLAIAAGAAACGGRPLSLPELPERSLGTVVLRLTVDPATPFCDQVSGCSSGPGHFGIATASGTKLALDPPSWCELLECTDQCPAPRCRTSACSIGWGNVFSGAERAWDGSYYELGTCGAGVTCGSRRYAPAGHYVASMCAGQGILVPPDGTLGADGPQCSAQDPPDCVMVPFDFPGPPVLGHLPL